MIKRIINKLTPDGFFGLPDYLVKKDDVEAIVNGESYIVPKGRKPHRIMPWESRPEIGRHFEVWMYRLPVIASEENQMRLFQ